MTNVEAVDRMVAALEGRLSDEQVAFVAAVRGLAGLVDLNPSDVSVWREYRLMLQALQEVVGDNAADEVADLRSKFEAEVRNSKD
jgi:hypothetical protein